MLLLLLPFAGLLLLTLFVIKSFSTSTNVVTGTKQFTTHLPHLSLRISLQLLFVAWTSEFEMTSHLDHYVLKYKVGHTVPSYISRFVGCNYGSWTHVKTAFSYGSLDDMSAVCRVRVTCYLMDSEISMCKYLGSWSLAYVGALINCRTRQINGIY